MKVYVVVYNDIFQGCQCEDGNPLREVHGVFLSRELAEKYIQNSKRNYFSFDIEEFDEVR